MMTTPNKQDRPVTDTVVYDMDKVMERIEKIEFLPDKVVIQMADRSIGTQWTIEVLKARLFLENGTMTGKIDFDTLASWDDDLATYTIPIANVRKIIIYDSYDCREVSK